MNQATARSLIAKTITLLARLDAVELIESKMTLQTRNWR
jgi:hypothetical protein